MIKANPDQRGCEGAHQGRPGDRIDRQAIDGDEERGDDCASADAVDAANQADHQTQHENAARAAPVFLLTKLKDQFVGGELQHADARFALYGRSIGRFARFENVFRHAHADPQQHATGERLEASARRPVRKAG